MFSKFSSLKNKGNKNMSNSTECLFGDDITNPVQELDEKMIKLSLVSKQPQLTREIDEKISVQNMKPSMNIENEYETQNNSEQVLPIVCESEYTFQHGSSRFNYRNKWNRSRRLTGGRKIFMNQSFTPTQELNELKQDVEEEISVHFMESSMNMDNNCEPPVVPNYVNSSNRNHNLWNTPYQHRSVHQRYVNQPMVQLRRMFSWVRGPQTGSKNYLNDNFRFEPYQQNSSMQRSPTEPVGIKSPKDHSFKKSRLDSTLFHDLFLKKRPSCDNSNESALLIPKEN